MLNNLEDNNKNIAVIGGGPAGMSCALWLKYFGFSPIIIDKNNSLGGLQKLSNFENVFYLGQLGKTGYQLAQEFSQHIQAEDISTQLGSQLQRIIKVGNNFKIFTERNQITARCLVLTTGQRFKGYEAIKSVEGSQDLSSSPLVCFNPGETPILAPRVEAQTVAVIGGSDNGLVTARILADTAQHVHLFVRSKLRGFRQNQQAIFERINKGKITLHQPATIHRFKVASDKIHIVFTDKNNQDSELIFDNLCFRLGFSPNVEQINQLLQDGVVGSFELTSGGYIATDQFLRTSIPNIYAAGDVANPRDPCVATAVAQGAIAARSIEEDLRYDYEIGEATTNTLAASPN